MDKIKLAYASAIATVLTIIYVVAVTIYAEFSAPFKNFLASFTGHHWITKSLSSVGLYVLVVLVIYTFKRHSATEAGLNKILWLIFGTAIAGSVFIAGFYFWHFLAT